MDCAREREMKFLFISVILIIMLCPSFSFFIFKRVQGLSSPELIVWANEGGDKVTRDELRASANTDAVLNSVWNGNRISLFGARNEVVSFNLVIEAPDSDITNVDVKISSLTGPDDAFISSHSVSGDGVFNFVGRNIELFYVQYLEIEGLSTDLAVAGIDYDERHIPERFRLPYNEDYEGIGDWNDRPDHNKYYPEIAVPLELASPFTINAGTCQSIWCDINIPKEVPSGNYNGTVLIQVDGDVSNEIPLTLKVRSFTLPDFPSAKTMVYISYENINDRYLGDKYIDPESNTYLQSIKLADLHFQLAHRHKISLIDGWDYDPSQKTPIEDMMEPRMSYLTGDLFTPSQGYEGIGVGVGNNVFSIGTYGSWPWQDGSEADMWRNTDAWVNWFDKQAFVTPTEYFLYLIDESDDFPRIERWAEWMDNNPGPGKKLGSLATISLPTAVTKTPSLDIPTSIVEIGVTDVWEKAVESHKAKPGTKFYMYNSQRPSSGSFAIEDDGIALRELAWGQYKKGVERWFFWESTYYNNEQGNTGETNVFHQAQTFGDYDRLDSSLGKTGWNYFNGDGVLFYPGTDTRFPEDSYGVKGPFASLRLKHWRRGIQDVDYLTLSSQIDPVRTAKIVDRIIPKVLWEYGVEDPDDPTWLLTDLSWSNNPEVWEAARLELADIIEGVEPIDTGSEKSSSEITIKASKSEIDEGDTIMVSGEILPPVSKFPVTLKYSDPDGLTFERTIITDQDGTYKDYYSPTKTGQWNVIASWEGDFTHSRSTSQTTSFTVSESKSKPEPESSDGGEIPGFPYESILIGLIVGIFVLCARSWRSPHARRLKLLFMTNRQIHINLILLLVLFLIIPNANAQVFETISIYVFDDNTETPVNGASVFLQIPSSNDPNYPYYDANYAAQLPIIVNKQTGMDGRITYNLEADEYGALKQANAEDMFTDFILEVRIEHNDYLTFHGYQKFSVNGQHFSLIYGLQSKSTVPNSGTQQKIRIYVKDIDGNPINGAGVTSISQPSGQITLSGTTGSEGYVTFDEVKTGSYTFLASASGYESSSESVSTSVGELFEKTILIEEEPKGIPGFPYESLITGLLLGTFLYSLVQQRWKA